MRARPQSPEPPAQPLHHHQTEEEGGLCYYPWAKDISLPFSSSSFTRNNFSDTGKAENKEESEMPKEQLGNRGSIQRSLQGEMSRDGRSTLVCPARVWELPVTLCGDPSVPQPGPGCPTLCGQSGIDPQRWDTVFTSRGLSHM